MERDRYHESDDDENTTAERKHAARQHIRVPLPREAAPELPPVEKNPLWRFERSASGLSFLLDDKETEPHPRNVEHSPESGAGPDDDDSDEDVASRPAQKGIVSNIEPPARNRERQWRPAQRQNEAFAEDKVLAPRVRPAHLADADTTHTLPPAPAMEMSHAEGGVPQDHAEADLATALEERSAAATAFAAVEAATDNASEDEPPASPVPPSPATVYSPFHVAHADTAPAITSTPNTPNMPPHVPHATPPGAGHVAPPLPPFGGAPPHSPNIPPFGPAAGGYNTASLPPSPNVMPAPVVIEREHTTDRFGNVLSIVAIIGLLREKGKRKKGDAENEAAIAKEKKRLDEQRSELSVHAQKFREHERMAQYHQGEHVRTMSTAGRTQETPPPWSPNAPGRPLPPERPVPVSAFPPRAETPYAPQPNIVEPRPSLAPAQNLEQVPGGQQARAEAIAFPPEQYMQTSGIAGNVGNRPPGMPEAADRRQYGQDFQQQRRHEAPPQATASFGATIATATRSGYADPSANVHPSLPSGMTSPGLPLGSPVYQDPQHRLPEPHKAPSIKGNLLLWLLVALVAFVVVMGLRLL